MRNGHVYSFHPLDPKFLPKGPHDELVLREPVPQNDHLHRVHRRRHFDSILFGLGDRVGAGLSAADRLHQHPAPGCQEPGCWHAPPDD